jgi:hypothetical protein
MTGDDATLLQAEDEPFLRNAVAASLRFLGFLGRQPERC